MSNAASDAARMAAEVGATHAGQDADGMWIAYVPDWIGVGHDATRRDDLRRHSAERAIRRAWPRHMHVPSIWSERREDLPAPPGTTAYARSGSPRLPQEWPATRATNPHIGSE